MSNQVSEITAPAALSTGGGAPTFPSQLPLTPSRKAWIENITLLLNHKILIFSVSAMVTLAVGIYAFTAMPNYYTAAAVILPARKAGGGLDNITSGIAASLKDLGMAKLQGGEESYSPFSLMRSRSLIEEEVRQFNFVRIYKAESISEAIEQFGQHLDGELTEQGNFIVSFEDTNPKRAAEVANAVIGGINKVNSRLAQDEAIHNFNISKSRYAQNVADLDSAEHALGEFQRKYGVYSLSDQAKAQLAALATLEQEKYSAQIQLQNAEQMYGANSSEVGVYRNTVEQLASKLASMQTGLDLNAASFVPSAVMPDVALQYLRLTREVEIQSKLKAFLLPVYEQARMDQEKNLYSYVLLDPAVPPTKKSKPHRSILLIAAMVGSSLTVSLAIIVLTYLRRLRYNFVRDQRRVMF
jgi:tyrosine-protein kinase Etk/Wzc